MQTDLRLKENFTVSLKPNRLFIKTIDEIKEGKTSIYYELLHDHFEDVITPERTNEAGEVEPEKTTRVLRYTIALFKGNETIPANFLMPLLSGNVEQTNMILGGFKWYGPFAGLKMELATQ